MAADLFAWAETRKPLKALPLGPIKPEEVLVLMPCSGTKLETAVSVPLHELYTGPLWQSLKAHIGAIEWSQVFVLSGGLGFRNSCSNHKPYEKRISAAQVDELLERTIHEYPKGKPGHTPPGPCPYAELCRYAEPLSCELAPWRKVIIAGAGEYKRGFLGIVEQAKAAGLIEAEAEVLVVEGGIGEQRGQLGRWLREINSIELEQAA